MTENPVMKYKQIILIRMDLDMSCGKKCVQVAHASMMVCDDALRTADALYNTPCVNEWKQEGMRKIVLKVPDLDTLHMYESKIRNLQLVTHLVTDFGLTQLEPNTITALGIEPLDVNRKVAIELAELTKDLKLL